MACVSTDRTWLQKLCTSPAKCFSCSIITRMVLLLSNYLSNPCFNVCMYVCMYVCVHVPIGVTIIGEAGFTFQHAIVSMTEKESNEVRTHIHTYIHTYIYVSISTYVHTYMHIAGE